MTLNDGSTISVKDIELLNAHGPYSMAIWTSGDVSVGNEEGLKGRSAYFTKVIRKSLLEKFSLDELATFSVLDVGCNDGWVLHELSDLPFAKMVGVEPRDKNIQKGKIVRHILKLENQVKYRCGDLESLGGETFDIVICAGVLYHVESIPFALRQLKKSCRRFLFLESRCLSSSFMSRKLRDQIEMRDLVYQFKKPTYGITAQKFESAYHDASAKETTIVNIPTTESLLMHLEILGFDEIRVVADTKTYRASVWLNQRPLDGVCITARVNPTNADDSFDDKKWIQKYESGLREAILQPELVHPLYEYLVEKKFPYQFSFKWLIVLLYIRSPIWLSTVFMRMLPFCAKGESELEIIKNLRYSPKDKITLELGKLLESERKLTDALRVLKQVSSRLNADWRSAYRSFFLMSNIYRSMGKHAEAERYLDLCLTCNPKYPVSGQPKAEESL
jgi:SAM-dependent methyltransferase